MPPLRLRHPVGQSRRNTRRDHPRRARPIQPHERARALREDSRRRCYGFRMSGGDDPRAGDGGLSSAVLVHSGRQVGRHDGQEAERCGAEGGLRRLLRKVRIPARRNVGRLLQRLHRGARRLHGGTRMAFGKRRSEATMIERTKEWRISSGRGRASRARHAVRHRRSRDLPRLRRRGGHCLAHPLHHRLRFTLIASSLQRRGWRRLASSTTLLGVRRDRPRMLAQRRVSTCPSR
jgi:hypothetical protein